MSFLILPLMQIRSLRLTTLLLGLLCFSQQATADDWPQINGPNRNGVSQEKLIDTWPTDGLKKVWSHPLGQGFAGPVVSDGTLYVFHRPGKLYLVEALDAKTGKPTWTKELPSEYSGGMDGDRGPKCTPLVHDKKIYLLGPGGNLFCLETSNGEVVWQKNLIDDYSTDVGFFGGGSTPIAIGSNLLVNVGGKDSGVVAFDLKTGKEKWKSFDDRASYSSPIQVQLGGKSVAVFITRVNLIGIDPESGEVLFQTPFGKKGTTVNGAMPVHFQVDGADYLFASSEYRIGGQLYKVNDMTLEKGWGNDESFSTHYSTAVFRDGFLFGTAGRRDYSNGSFRCVNALTGEVAWERSGVPVGHAILAGDKIVHLDSDGDFHIFKASNSYERIYKTRLFETDAFAIPALSNGLFYARSNAGKSGKGELLCVEIGIR